MKNEMNETLAALGLTPSLYEECLSLAAKKTNRETDMDWADIIGKYNLNLHPDTMRKASQTVFGGAFVYSYFKNKGAFDNSDYLNELRKIKNEIRIEKTKLSDERAAINKCSREKARTQEDLQRMENLIRSKAERLLVNPESPQYVSDNDLIICVSDFHLGINAESSFGKYNSDIAKERLEKYLSEIKKIRDVHRPQNAYVFFLGDLISGEIHMTTQLENRENLTTQIQRSAELLTEFVYSLCAEFNHVYVHGVAGNHSRTSFKDQVLRGNRLDNLIPWYMKASLSHIKNVTFCDNVKYDDTIGCISIRDNEYLLVHGDFDSFSESGVSKLVMMIGHKPSAIFYGHMHKCSYDEISNIKIVRSGSFSGTSDDYTVSHRMSGKPSQMVCVVSDSGINCCYPISLI